MNTRLVVSSLLTGFVAVAGVAYEALAIVHLLDFIPHITQSLPARAAARLASSPSGAAILALGATAVVVLAVRTFHRQRRRKRTATSAAPNIIVTEDTDIIEVSHEKSFFGRYYVTKIVRSRRHRRRTG